MSTIEKPVDMETDSNPPGAPKAMSEEEARKKAFHELKQAKYTLFFDAVYGSFDDERIKTFLEKTGRTRQWLDTIKPYGFVCHLMAESQLLATEWEKVMGFTRFKIGTTKDEFVKLFNAANSIAKSGITWTNWVSTARNEAIRVSVKLADKKKTAQKRDRSSSAGSTERPSKAIVVKAGGSFSVGGVNTPAQDRLKSGSNTLDDAVKLMERFGTSQDEIEAFRKEQLEEAAKAKAEAAAEGTPTSWAEACEMTNTSNPFSLLVYYDDGNGGKVPIDKAADFQRWLTWLEIYLDMKDDDLLEDDDAPSMVLAKAGFFRDRGVLIAKNEDTYKHLLENVGKIGQWKKQKNNDGQEVNVMVPGVDGKVFKAWPVKGEERATVVLRLMYPPSVVQRPDQDFEKMFMKSLIKSGVSKRNPKPLVDGVSNEELRDHGRFFYMDVNQPNVLCFTATPQLVQAILVNRNCKEQPFQCNSGCLQAGTYVQPVFLGREMLTKDTKVDFTDNLLPPKQKRFQNPRNDSRK